MMTRTDITMQRQRKRVVVIGSGLAGLTTAYLLRNEGFHVWLIEKSDRLGFHSASVHIPVNRKHVNSAESDGSDSGVDVSNDGHEAPEGKGAASSSGTASTSDGPDWAVSAKGDEWVIDVPMRSFQGGYYPLLISLYHHLGLPLIPSDFTFSFSHLLSESTNPSSSKSNNQPQSYEQDTYFLHSGSSGISLPALPIRAHRSIRRLTRYIFRFISVAACYFFWLFLCLLGYHNLLPFSRSIPLGTATDRISNWLNYPVFIPLLPIPSSHVGSVFRKFVNTLVIPMFSAVGTMTTQDVLQTPVGCVVDYVHSTVGTTHFRLSADTGAREVARRLARKVRDQGEGYLKLGEEVKGLEYMKDGTVEVRLRRDSVRVDTVILATQASAAEKLLGMLNEEGLRDVQEALRDVQYRESIVVTHRDTSILPRKGDERDINLVTPRLASSSSTSSPYSEQPKPSLATASNWQAEADSTPMFPLDADRIYTCATHLIRPPAHFSNELPILQTTNPVMPIDLKTVLGVAHLERALPVSQSLLETIHQSPSSSGPAPRILIVGSYAYPGIPLLEGCVGSALRVTRELVRQTSTASESHDVRGLDTRKEKEKEKGRVRFSDDNNEKRERPSFSRRSSKSRISRAESAGIGGVDWTVGAGSQVGRWWRWRWRREGEIF